MCRAAADDATAATMTGLDPAGAVFEIERATGCEELRLAWRRVPVTRADIRAELVGMLASARAEEDA